MEPMKSSFVGESPAIQDILNQIDQYSLTDQHLLIRGESGTGKELVAQAIHAGSSRRNGAMISVSCGAIPGDLLEAELFGLYKGGQGRFEIAQGGTLYLDEINEMPLHVQAKLLRALQTRQAEVAGGGRSYEFNVRVIAATSADLEGAVSRREFREDLYHRFSGAVMRIPALRARKSDIPVLTKAFVQRFNALTGHSVSTPDGKVMDALMAYDWPGNVRELENLMERLVIMKNNGGIELEDLPTKVFRKYAEDQSPGAGAVSEWDFPRMMLPQNGLDLKVIVSAFENHLIDQALTRTHGNKNKASELLQMNRTTLVEKLRRRGMITPLKKKEIEGTS
ncbi:MAG: sigma-54-dependent Fis family transcriptional regulator [Bdellovibrionales bacterium]|nr:sigma-54-dependent Fis family transcriptional regulator [Bdellovibrionales bacterium]